LMEWSWMMSWCRSSQISLSYKIER
jgi:hypothetical protein